MLLLIINECVKDRTNSKVDNIVKSEDLDASTMLILLNVIYFNGLWLQQFDKAETSTRVFRLSNEGKKQILMMHRSGIYKYYEDNCFQTISLPYTDDKLSMIIFLPRENAITSTIFRRVLKTKNYGEWTSRLQDAEGTIGIPRIRIEYETDLCEALTSSGMGVAFRSDVNFQIYADICESYVRISRIRYKAF